MSVAADTTNTESIGVERTDAWANGKVMGIRWRSDKGVIAGAASAKNSIGYARAL